MMVGRYLTLPATAPQAFFITHHDAPYRRCDIGGVAFNEDGRSRRGWDDHRRYNGEKAGYFKTNFSDDTPTLTATMVKDFFGCYFRLDSAAYAISGGAHVFRLRQ